MKKALLTLGIFLCVGALFFAVWPRPKKAGHPQSVTIADGSQTVGASLYAALSQGFFEEEGVAVQFKPYPFGKPALAALIQGDADFATVATTPFVHAVIEGHDVRLLATLGKAENYNGILALENSSIREPGDLKGKKIGVAFDTSAEYFLNIFLNLNDIRGRDVEKIDLNPAEMEEALRSGRVDAVSLWDLDLSQLAARLEGQVRIFHYEGLFDLYWNIVSTEQFLKTHSGIVEKVLRALKKGNEWCGRNAPACQRVVAQYLNLNLKNVIRSWPNSRFDMTMTQSLLIHSENEARWYIEYKNGGKKIPNFLDYFDAQALKQVDASKMTLIE